MPSEQRTVAMTLHDPFGRSRLPPGLLAREEKIALLAVAAQALQSGRPVPATAAELLGTALAAWLKLGGDLEQHLAVRAPAGSHVTPAALARRFVVEGEALTELKQSKQTRRFPARSSRGVQIETEPGSILDL